ncbi:MAG TPA: 5-oxoprolinase subunit PxpA [Candidatus Acidoferrales bacterium]|nr:5-oxoprolinase subunit PxpA [Candidatus Acidoferrales bacterium]
MQTLRVDLNADVGESFGARRSGDDEPIFRYVTSGNVACGFHAGDPNIIAATIKAASACGVSVGAHPSYPDSGGFGRTSIEIAPDDLENAVLYQIGAVDAVARGLGVRLVHVKPHGALYNDAAKNGAIAAAIARSVAAYDRELILVGLAGSLSLEAARDAGLRFVAEGFCDRAYEADGSLRSRARSGAVYEDPKKAAAQALEIVVRNRVETGGGKTTAVHAQTLCIHGDSPNATEIASAVRGALAEAGVRVVPMSQLA